MKRLSVAVAIMAFCFCPLARAKDKDWLIVPGQRIGLVSIGMEHAEVLRLLGTPHREDDLAYRPDGEGSKEFKDALRDDWIMPRPVAAHPEGGEGVFMANFVTVYCKNRLVVQIEVRAPRFKTKEGLSSASTGAEWRRHFPHGKESFIHFRHPSSGGWPGAKHLIDFQDALEAGVAWRCGVMGDLAPDPNPDGWVEAVAVHAPGKAMLIDPDGGSRFIWKDAPRRLSTEH